MLGRSYKQVHHDSGYSGMCEVWTLYLPASCTLLLIFR